MTLEKPIGGEDLLTSTFESLAMFTSDLDRQGQNSCRPIGNEEQLMNPSRKGALVDLRPAPHRVISVRRQGKNEPFRAQDGQASMERAYGDQDNFIAEPIGRGYS